MLLELKDFQARNSGVAAVGS